MSYSGRLISLDHLRQKRLVYLFLIFFSCFLGLVSQLFLIQYRDGELYACLALEQGSRWVSLENTPRGRILDRNLVPLTGERTEERVVLFPAAVGNREEVSSELAGILGVEQDNLSPYFDGEPCLLPYVVTPEQSAAVQNRGWTGVMALPVQFRYGEQQLAAQVIGHMGKISTPEEFTDLSGRNNKVYHYDDLVGKTGLEMYYEDVLKGSLPQRAVRCTPMLRAGCWGTGFFVEEQTEDYARCDLVLTIDARIQKIVEEIMDHSVARGAVVVMDAGSGDILAMASRPGYHPARPEDYLDAAGGENCFLDHCTALYQPGSVFKVVIAAAALEEGVADFAGQFHCRGAGETLLRCWKPQGHGAITFVQAFAESCNPVFAKLGLQLGAQKVIDYAGLFGLDNQSVLGYPAPRDPRQDLKLIAGPYNLVNSSIGQGPVLVTPVQVAAMINTVVSGGFYRQPRLVQRICNSNGDTVQMLPYDPGQGLFLQKPRKSCASCWKWPRRRAPDKRPWCLFSAARKDRDRPGRRQSLSVNAWFAGYAPGPIPLCGSRLKRREAGGSGSSACFQGNHGGYPGAGLSKHNLDVYPEKRHLQPSAGAASETMG